MTRGEGSYILRHHNSKIVNDVDRINVSDINCPNENDGTSMPVINYIIKDGVRTSVHNYH